MHGGKRAEISAPKLTLRHSDRGRFHGSDHTIQGGDLNCDFAALRTEPARGKLPAVETFDAANADGLSSGPGVSDTSAGLRSAQVPARRVSDPSSSVPRHRDRKSVV